MDTLLKTPLRFNKIKLYEYSLVVRPDAVVSEKVSAEKQWFTKYLIKGYSSRSYITIANFMAKEAMEETIIRYTERITFKHSAFKIQLNNYTDFPPNSIYLRVLNPLPFKQLAKELTVVSNYINSCSCPPAFINSQPHICIAKNIPENIYPEAMKEYSAICFNETFMVNELVLIKK